MKTNVKRMLSHFYKNVTVNDVLKEAVMNSIQANATDIRINLEYEYNQNIDNESSNLGNLYKIIVSDNGEGLNSKNLNAFFEVGTENKINLGGKGIGRFSFLKIARSVSIESVSDAGKYITFEFSYDSNLESVSIQEAIEPDPYTTITFCELNLKHPKTQAQACLTFLKKTFNLFLFLKQKETSKPINIRLLVNGELLGKINSSDIHCIQQSELESNNCKFNIYTFWEDNKSEIDILYCANNITVKTITYQINLDKKYLFAVTSDYFDRKANSERTKFEFDSNEELAQQDILNSTPDKNFDDLIKRTCFNIVQANEPELVQKNIAQLEKLKEQFGYINFDEIDINVVSFNETEIIKSYRERRDREEDNLIRLLNNDTASLDEIAEKVSEQNKHELAKYIFHRNLIVQKGLKLQGSDENEKILHELFFPQKISTESYDVANPEHLYFNNIWLLDDKFMSYAYVASDLTIKTIKSDIGSEDCECISQKRPDLFVLYNNPEDSDLRKDVVLIEFKKGNIDYKEKLSAIDQVDEYKEKLKEIVKINNFYCYIICDFKADDRDVERVMTNRAFTKVFSNNECMYYGYLQGSNTHVTFISSNSIFADAKARNETFLNILKRDSN
ncbi:ATP-binding protein [Snodgrassella alvi]|uniref:ATP-binding protein n=1 Tax=Snodgrassella alvi TaxID=1196083 RepID=UPI00352C5A2C